MSRFDCIFLSGKVACTVTASTPTQAAQKAVKVISGTYQMHRVPALACSIAHRYVGLYGWLPDQDATLFRDGGLLAVIVPVEVSA